MTTNQSQDINNYVNECWSKVWEYYNGVQNGTIITNQYIKNVVTWFKNTDKYEIKRKKIDRLFRFFYLINISYDGEGYKRFELLPWQAFQLALLLGLYERGTNNRRFTESFTYMGRGNGKTTTGVALSLYFMLGYNMHSPEAIIISTVENRGKVIKDLHKTVMNSSELYQYLHFNNGAVMLNTSDSNIKRGDRPIKFMTDVGTIKVVPNDDKKIDGLELVLAFIDEIHLLKDESVFRNAQKSAGKRSNSLVMLISTAGFSTEGFCVDLVNRAKKVAMGEIKDDKFLPFLYCLDETDNKEDISNKDLWYKANPSLGATKSMKKMESWYNDALYSPKAKADFMTKDLNIFIDYNEEEILSKEDIIKAAQPVDYDSLKGRDCYLGLDLSKSNDLSSLVALFEPLNDDDKWLAIPYYWIGNDSKLFKRNSGIDITPWIKAGYITKCDTKYIDNSLIIDKLEELSHQFNIMGIGYDPYGWNEFNKILINRDIEYGKTIPIIQWTKHMAEPLSKILMLIISEKLIFSDNPVMTWNFKNAKIRIADANGNLKIMKNECKDSVDGAIAMNNAMALYYKLELDPKRKTTY